MRLEQEILSHLRVGEEYADIPYLDERVLKLRKERALAAWYVVRYARHPSSEWIQEDDFIALCQEYFIYGNSNKPLQRRSVLAKVIEPGMGIFWERSDNQHGKAYTVFGAARVAYNLGIPYVNESVRRPLSELRMLNLRTTKAIFVRSSLERSSDHNRSLNTVSLQTGYCVRTLIRGTNNCGPIRKIRNWEVVKTIPFDGDHQTARQQAEKVMLALRRVMDDETAENGNKINAYFTMFRCHDGFIVVRRLANGYAPTHLGYTSLSRRMNARLRRLFGVEREWDSCNSHGKTPFNVSAHIRKATGIPLPGASRKAEAHLVRDGNRRFDSHGNQIRNRDSRRVERDSIWSPAARDGETAREAAVELINGFAANASANLRYVLSWIKRRTISSTLVRV